MNMTVQLPQKALPAIQLINEEAFLLAAAPRVLIAICSCHSNAARRKACRETWLQRLPGKVAAFFFLGAGSSMETVNDTVLLEVPDDYKNLTKKTSAMLEYACRAFRFDYLFKCDDDTFVAAHRLEELCGNDMCAFLWNNPKRSASGGAGYLLARSLAERLPGAIDETGYYEDVEVTLAARRLNAVIVPSSRLRVGHERFPRPDNDLVTAHWCKPDMLHRINEQWPPLPENP